MLSYLALSLLLVIHIQARSPVKPSPGCGPVCFIACPHGNVLDKNGCPICECKPAQKPVCGPICRMHCQYGFVTDKNGCPICKCNQKPTHPVKRTCPRLARANITCPLKNIDECTSDSECPGVQKCCIFGCIKKCL